MEDVSALQDEIDALSAQITKQGGKVREIKKDSRFDASAISEAVEALKSLKIESEGLRAKMEALSGGEGGDGALSFDRKTFDETILRKMFVVPSFEIHGGVKGLYDLGPPACALKAAVTDTWRKHFILNENMLEMECTCLTPAPVLATSGHVERFTDLMVKDVESGECFRADKLLEDTIDTLLESQPAMPTEDRESHQRIQRQADAFSPQEIDALLTDYGCVGPTGKPYSKAFPFNLMFKTSIGPEGTSVGYLRPETAQGLFVNFKRLLDYNAQKMPFAAAQIGLGFRNEIAPKAGLLRVREFTMGEIEHFVNPHDKTHPSFHTVQHMELVMFGQEDQLGSGKTKLMTIGEAVGTGLVNNETLAYFMARTQLFLEKIGMDKNRLRFRQHLKTEMAHYAQDCWDLEIKCSYGWIECVGHADRACYDLEVHATATKTPMFATLKYDKAQEIELAKLKFDRKKLGAAFRSDQRTVSAALEVLAESWDTFAPIAAALESDAKSATILDGKFTVTPDMFTYKKTKKMVHEVKFTPHVIEPSFGFGRIIYSLLEHSFYRRPGDDQKTVMRFNPLVAPNKCAVLPISVSSEVCAIVDDIAARLVSASLFTRVDKSTAALGRRYARSDELGVPFAVTVDFRSLEDATVTLRERDSTQQIRLPVDDVVGLVEGFVRGTCTWEDAKGKYPVVEVEDGETGAAAAAKDDGAKTKVEVTSRGKFSRPAKSIL